MKSGMLNHPLYMSQGMKGLKESTCLEIEIHHPPQIHDKKYNKINETNNIRGTSIYHKTQLSIIKHN